MHLLLKRILSPDSPRICKEYGRITFSSLVLPSNQQCNFTVSKHDDNRIWCLLLLKSMLMVLHVMHFIFDQSQPGISTYALASTKFFSRREIWLVLKIRSQFWPEIKEERLEPLLFATPAILT